MSAPNSVVVPDTPLGGTADIAVGMVAPDVPGAYRGVWQMRGPDGRLFGAQVWVMIDTRLTVQILIRNDTSGTLYLSLSGPATYNFTLGPGNQNIRVVPGTYSYTGRGCGGATKSGTEVISWLTGDWRWWCSSLWSP